jgi:hypothetical protein
MASLTRHIGYDSIETTAVRRREGSMTTSDAVAAYIDCLGLALLYGLHRVTGLLVTRRRRDGLTDPTRRDADHQPTLLAMRGPDAVFVSRETHLVLGSTLRGARC